MKRMGMVIGLKPDRAAEYKKLHAAVWPEVLATISACNIKNYTIFLREPENLLFAVWDDHGAEYKKLHAAVWPEVLATISACNIKNYTIFLREPENLLFAVWDYHGA